MLEKWISSNAPQDGERPRHVVIEPDTRLFSLDLDALWEYRELIYFIVWKDLKTRYKQTALGVGWAVLQPFLTMLIFTMIFSYVVHLPLQGIPYPLFAFTALVPWAYFSQAMSRSGMALVGNANLISKVYFPRLIIPLAAVTTPFVDLVLTSLVLLGLMAWYQHLPSMAVVWLPLFVGLAFLAALAIGLWLAALNVQYRDVTHVIPFLVQVGLFASPVAYPSSMVPAAWQGVYALNPMVAVIEGFRWCLLDTTPPSLQTIALGTLTVAVLFVSGLAYFKSTERKFADVI